MAIDNSTEIKSTILIIYEFQRCVVVFIDASAKLLRSILTGVVVVEDFIRHKNILGNPDESDEAILNALINLKEKKPSRDVLSKIGIEATLKVLKKHPNKVISKEAQSLLHYWALDSGSVKDHPTMEVRYDNMTKHLRRTSVNFFIKELGLDERDEKLGDIIEKEIFYKCNKLISKSYRKTVRKIIFVLRHHKDENELLKKGQMSPSDFVKKYLRAT